MGRLILSLFTVLFVLLSSIACGGGGGDDSDSKMTSVPTEGSKETPTQSATIEKEPQASVIDDPELLALLNPEPIPERQPTNFDLIDDAFESGDISESQAMGLRLIGGYEPEKLPSEFQSDVFTPRSNFQLAVKWLNENWDTLDPVAQNELLPYHVLPDDPRSYANQPDTHAGVQFQFVNYTTACDSSTPWTSITATVPGNPDAIPAIPERNALIHYCRGDATGEQQAEWIRDAFIQAYHNHSELMDTELDEDVYIFIEPMTEYGHEDMLNVGGARRSVIGIRHGLDERYTKTTTAHELFHSFQEMFGMRYRTTEQIWLAETTAVWSEHFVYPDWNSEHLYLNGFFEDLDRKMVGDDGNREYHAYPWYLFLTQWFGYDEVIKELWETQERRTVREAIMDHEYWDVAFHEFARWNWNQEPVQHFVDNPEFPGDPIGTESYRFYVVLPDEEEEVPVILEGLSMFYYSMVIDDFVERVEIRFEGEGNNQHRRQALVRVDGTWHLEDWTNMEERVFCRNWEHEEVEAIVLIYSNSSWDEIISENFTIDTTGFCEAQWRGYTKVTSQYKFSEAGTELTISGDYTVHTVKRRWEFVTNDLLIQDEEGNFKVESLFATYESDRTEEVNYERECSLLWEKERETKWGSVHLDYTNEDWQPTRFKVVFNDEDEPIGFILNPSASSENYWITERTNKESIDQSCIFAWKRSHWTDQQLRYEKKAGYHKNQNIEIDEMPVDQISGVINVPLEIGCDVCWVTIEYDYSYR